MPPQDSKVNWIGRKQCEKEYPEAKQPPIPYGKQSASTSLVTEQGFRRVRGQLTEGRYHTFEMNGYALTNPTKGDLTTTTSTANHETLNQRWILLQSDSQVNKFDVSSVVNGKYIAGLVTDCLPNETGYSLSLNDGYLSIDSSGGIAKSSQPAGFQIFSVSY
jgi:phospholipase C